MRYNIRSYKKPKGGYGYELYDTENNEVLQRDDSYLILRMAREDLNNGINERAEGGCMNLHVPKKDYAILKEPNEHGASKPETILLTDELCRRISECNGNLTPKQVRESLLSGKTIHTNFCKYSLFA